MPWSRWYDLGEPFKGAPAVTSWGPDRVDLFGWARETGILWHRALEGDSWTEWEDLGGPFSSPAAAVAVSPGIINLVARGMDHRVYIKWFDRAWSNWFDMGGSFTREPWTPAIAKTGPRHLEVMALGDDSAVYRRLFDGNRQTWTGWESMGGDFAIGPKVQPFIFGVFIKAWDREGNAWQRQAMAGRWTANWKPLGKIPVPAAETFWIVGERQVGNQTRLLVRFDQFVLQPDQSLWHQSYTQMDGERGSESAWENLGGPYEGAAAVSPSPGRLDLFATGTDGHIWYRNLREAVA